MLGYFPDTCWRSSEHTHAGNNPACGTPGPADLCGNEQGRVDGVEVDATIYHVGAVKFDLSQPPTASTYIAAVGIIAVKPPTCMTPCKSTTIRELVGGLFSFLCGLMASRSSLRSVDP